MRTLRTRVSACSLLHLSKQTHGNQHTARQRDTHMRTPCRGSSRSHRFTCKDTLWTREDFDVYKCEGAPSSTLTGISRTCFELEEGQLWVYVDCASSKSTLSTGAIIGITIGVLFIVITHWIHLSQTTHNNSWSSENCTCAQWLKVGFITL